MDSLYAIYENPTGTLPAEELATLIEQAQLAHAEAESVGALDFVVDTIKPVADSISEAAGAGPGTGRKLRFLLSGKGDVEQICPGLMASPTKDLENGSVRYQVALRDNFVLKTIWGTFDQCQFHAGGRGVTFDGTWALSLGTNQLVTTLQVENVLVKVEGTLTGSMAGTSIERDFLVNRNGTIGIRVPVADGDVICASDEEKGRVSVRTRDGAFCCILSDQECYALEGDTCESADAGGKRISW